MKLRWAILLVAVWGWSGCQVAPQPIRYGEEICHYCSMTIVDKGFAAELVTYKGKAYKFDAIECMLSSLHSENESEYALFLTNHLDEPGELNDATQSVFLITKAIPSPMGGYLSAFDDETAARQALGEASGNIYDWDELRNSFQLKTD